MCSSQSADLVSFDIVFTRGVVVFFSRLFGCLHFPEGSCFFFLASYGFFTPTALLIFFVGLIHLSPVFSFSAFIQRQTGGIPAVINQEVTPSFFFSVVDIDVCLQLLGILLELSASVL